MYARHHGALLIGAIALSLTVTGCTAPEGPADAAAPSAAPSSAADPSGHETSPHDHEEDHPSAEIPEAAPESRDAALEAAEHVVAMFGRPEMDQKQWWDELVPLLSQKGAFAYEGTRAVNVPIRAVTGEGTVLDASTDVMLIVQVPTDAGLYNVTLSRGGVDEPWLAERIRPADAS